MVILWLGFLALKSNQHRVVKTPVFGSVVFAKLVGAAGSLLSLEIMSCDDIEILGADLKNLPPFPPLEPYYAGPLGAASHMNSTRGDPTGEYGISLREEILQVIEEWKKPRPVPVLDPTESEPFMERRDGRGPGRFLPIKKEPTYNIMKLVNNMIFGIPEETKEGYACLLAVEFKAINDLRLQLLLRELEDPLIFIHEKKISSVNAFMRALELALRRQKPLLIMAKDVDSEALATIILNKLRAGIKLWSTYIKRPMVLIGASLGTVVTIDLSVKYPEAINTFSNFGCLSRCCRLLSSTGNLATLPKAVAYAEVSISKEDIVILDGAGQKKSIEERCEQIKSLSTFDYDKEKLQERIAKISGGVTEIHV
ncbi:hypothetical protein CQW23_12295 [Capsicum baccatum]|uniref:Uncharacterized protein n=1 Tax=Capsicum baccatum TaxID=33114 RepID=A0A2G2WS68_CAPBA|nr:hypothetical protein CQW23_12295 [Capsicum baccatum]